MRESPRPGFPTPPRRHGPHACPLPMVVGERGDQHTRGKRYRRRRPALMIIRNCSPICKTNPSVIVQLLEFDGIGRAARFAWDAVSSTCAVSVDAHRSACNSRGAHRLSVVVVFVLVVVQLRTSLQYVDRIACESTYCTSRGICRIADGQRYTACQSHE